MKTMKVKPWAEGQGDHVLINAHDYDASVHEALDPVDVAAEDDANETEAAPARRGRKPKAE